MLVHLAPQMFACRKNEPCSLIDLTCAEFGLFLDGGKELTARRPYPNKDYLVACRKVGQKAMNGILIESQEPIREFTVVVRWAVAASHIATHRVRYIVLDDEYDTLSENMVLWYATHESCGGLESRWPEDYGYGTPATTQPRMEVFGRLNKDGDFSDVINDQGVLIERSEVFRLPTLQRQRVLNVERSFDPRIPAIETAFLATVPSKTNARPSGSASELVQS